MKITLITAIVDDEASVTEGHNQSTGLVVVAKDLKPDETKSTDLSILNCRATRLKFSFIWRWVASGYEEELHWKDITMEQGGYISEHEFVIRNACKTCDNNHPVMPEMDSAD